MINKHYEFGRLHICAGTSPRWGVELTVEFTEPALAIHVLNVWVVFEWWRKNVGG